MKDALWWLDGALKCEHFPWDEDQRECAQLALDAARLAPPEPGAAFEAVGEAPVTLDAALKSAQIAIGDLSAIEAMLGGRNGPSLRLRAFIQERIETLQRTQPTPAPPGIGMSEAEIEELAKQLTWVGFRQDAEGHYTIPSISPSVLKLIRLVEAHHGIPGARPLVDEGSPNDL